MEVEKQAQAQCGGEPTPEQLEAINALAKAKLTAQQVYVFSLRLCDDQLDRDQERFDTQALPVLAKMFVGKTGITDHNWSSQKQVARIFSTEVVREEDVSYIRAWAYIRRGESTQALIEDIEAGIKKEISVGCAMGKAVCSACGAEAGTCGHQKGEYYDGQLCHTILREPVDAYEFSFVAVPAQRDAGVLKAVGAGQRKLGELAQAYGAQAEYTGLCKLAELGRRYEKQLRDQTVRLCLMMDLGLEEAMLRSLAEKATASELQTLNAALEKKVQSEMPPQTQLRWGTERESPVENGFLI